MKMNSTRQTWGELKPLYDDLNARKGNFNTLKVPFMGPNTACRTEKGHKLLLNISLCQRSWWPKGYVTLLL